MYSAVLSVLMVCAYVTGSTGSAFSNEIQCEHKTVSLQCSAGTYLKIKSANYGRTITQEQVCNYARRSVDRTDCYGANALDIVRNSCENKNSCSVKADNSVFGDPCLGTFKYINVTYDCESVCDMFDLDAPLTDSALLLARIAAHPDITAVFYAACRFYSADLSFDEMLVKGGQELLALFLALTEGDSSSSSSSSSRSGSKSADSSSGENNPVKDWINVVKDKITGAAGAIKDPVQSPKDKVAGILDRVRNRPAVVPPVRSPPVVLPPAPESVESESSESKSKKSKSKKSKSKGSKSKGSKSKSSKSK